MDFSTLTGFRRDAYACFTRAADALMNVADALLTETRARSLAELSLSPFFERRWPSLYEAFQDAKIDRDALQNLFVQHAPMPPQGQRLVLGGDASSILRVQSPTASDRTYVHASNLPEGTKPVRPGWQFSELAVLPNEKSSWAYILDNRRIASTATQGQVMTEQLRQTVSRLARRNANEALCRALFLGDGYYGSESFRISMSDIDCDVLVRFAKNRILYREVAPVLGKRKRGRPKEHGDAFKIKDPATYGEAEQSFDGVNEAGKRIEVHCWHTLHFKQAPKNPVTLIQVIRHGAADTKRDPKVSWFVFWGKDMPALQEIPALYARRYNLEHSYRTAKQNLLWEEPRLRTPEQFCVWTDIVSLVRNQLFLARDLVAAQRQPWERSCRSRTPEQVRRGMGRIIGQLGTPARVCRPRGKCAGWPLGRSRGPVGTYKVVFKGSEKPSKGAKAPSGKRPQVAKVA
jgi:hypothetical protein